MLISGKLNQKELLKILVEIDLKAKENKNLQVNEVVQIIAERLKSYY